MARTTDVLQIKLEIQGDGTVKATLAEIGEQAERAGKRAQGAAGGVRLLGDAIAAFGVAKMVLDELDKADVKYEVFDDVKANPTTKNVKDALAAFKAFTPQQRTAHDRLHRGAGERRADHQPRGARAVAAC